MNRMYIGLVLLVVILILGISLTAAFSLIHRPMAATLEQAKQAALSDEWEKAEALADKARAEWEKYRELTAAVADHEPLEQMDALFARLEVVERLRDAGEFAADCAELSRLSVAMAQSQSIHWWCLL